jgi:hypothetical protein
MNRDKTSGCAKPPGRRLHLDGCPVISALLPTRKQSKHKPRRAAHGGRRG